MKKHLLKKMRFAIPVLTLPIISLPFSSLSSCSNEINEIFTPTFSFVEKSKNYIISNEEIVIFKFFCDSKNSFNRIDDCIILENDKLSIVGKKTDIPIDDKGVFSLSLKVTGQIENSQDMKFKILFSYTIDDEESFSIFDDSNLTFFYDKPKILIESYDDYCYQPNQPINYKFKFDNIHIPTQITSLAIHDNNIEAVGVTENIPVDPISHTFNLSFQLKNRPEDKTITYSASMDLRCQYEDGTFAVPTVFPFTYKQQECKILNQSNNYLINKNIVVLDCQLLTYNDVYPSKIDKVDINTTSEKVSLQESLNIPVTNDGKFNVTLLFSNEDDISTTIDKIFYSLNVMYTIGDSTYITSTNQMVVTTIYDTKQSDEELYFIPTDDGVLNLANTNEYYAQDYWYKKNNDTDWTQFVPLTVDYQAGDIISVRKDSWTWSDTHDDPIGLYFSTPVYVGGRLIRSIEDSEFDTPGKLSTDCFPYMFYDADNDLWSDIIGADENLFQGITEVGRYSLCGLFSHCTNLEYAPTLPDFVVNDGGLNQLFYQCKKLNKIKTLATKSFFGKGTNDWVTGVSPQGEFLYNGEYSSEDFGDSGIPNNWTVTPF